MLRHPPEIPFLNENSLAIAIAGSAITGDRAQRHVAFLYKVVRPALLMLHLGWHERLYYHDWPGRDYSWIEVNGLDPDLQELFVAWIEIVAFAGQDGTRPIPYSAFFRPSGNFDQTGHYIDARDGSGLTCATFILALFNDYGLPLIVPDSWPIRIEDRRWFRIMWGRLRNVVPKWNLLLQFQRRRQLKRFRPEEVLVAAAVYSGRPLTYAELDAHIAQHAPVLPS